jgi:predicted PurR-regulated permease PerM
MLRTHPVSTPTPARYIFLTVILILLLAAAWVVRGVLLLTLASIILVTLFTMPTRFLIRHGFSRWLATTVSLVFIFVSVIALAAFALPELFRQATTLATVLIPQGIEALAERWTSGDLQQQFPFLQGITPEDIENVIDALSTQLLNALGQFGVSVLPVLGGVADTVLSILIVIFLSLYLLADPNAHQEGIVRLFPPWYRGRVQQIIARLDATLRGWLKATIFSMLFVGIATWIGLGVVGIRESAALGVLAGVASFIPNFGPLIALVPSLAVGIVQIPDSLLWIVVVIYDVSFVQSQIVIPILVAGSIRLPAVLVLLGQIVAGAFLGFLGIMLAVPITAILMVLVQEVYIRDVLGDNSISQSDPIAMPATAAEEAVHTAALPDAGS